MQTAYLLSSRSQQFIWQSRSIGHRYIRVIRVLGHSLCTKGIWPLQEKKLTHLYIFGLFKTSYNMYEAHNHDLCLKFRVCVFRSTIVEHQDVGLSFKSWSRLSLILAIFSTLLATHSCCDEISFSCGIFLKIISLQLRGFWLYKMYATVNCAWYNWEGHGIIASHVPSNMFEVCFQ